MVICVFVCMIGVRGLVPRDMCLGARCICACVYCAPVWHCASHIVPAQGVTWHFFRVRNVVGDVWRLDRLWRHPNGHIAKKGFVVDGRWMCGWVVDRGVAGMSATAHFNHVLQCESNTSND